MTETGRVRVRWRRDGARAGARVGDTCLLPLDEAAGLVVMEDAEVVEHTLSPAELEAGARWVVTVFEEVRGGRRADVWLQPRARRAVYIRALQILFPEHAAELCAAL